MKCLECGNDLRLGASFCVNCGARISNNQKKALRKEAVKELPANRFVFWICEDWHAKNNGEENS